jgi:hypothetical protein
MNIVRSLLELDRRPSPHNEGFTVGEERWLIWQIRSKWWMKIFPYRTYPILPFERRVYWHLWGGKWRIWFPAPWLKPLLNDDDFPGVDHPGQL